MEHLEQDLIELMMRLEGITRREMMSRYRRNHSTYNPHRGQGRIMSILKMQPTISQKDLGFLLDMSKQALAELLGKLEAAGYITRTPFEQDKRVMMIHLTEEGRKAADQLEKQETETSSVFSCLTADEQKTLYDYLTRLIEEGEKRLPDGLKRHYRNSHRMFDQDGRRRND